MPTDIDMRGTEPNTSFSSLKQIDAGELNVGYAEVGPGDGPAVIARGAGRHCGCHPAHGLGAGILRAERSTAWKRSPSWAVVATGDKAAGTDIVRSMAMRAGAKI
jgi:hypothetical protein